MSVGNQDAVGMSPSESPGDESVSSERHAVGTTPTDECFDDEGDDATEEGASVADKSVDAANSDSFCGRLDYNADTTKFNQKSPVDQDLRGPIETFDVQYASYVGNYGLSTCLPYCLPGGITAYRTAHDVMNDQGLSDDGETADDEDDGGWQEYAANTLYPNALVLAQQETGTWESNGWAHTIGDQQFIGFLYEDGGGVVDDTRLQEIFDSQNLPSDAEPVVCGFTPDQEVTISATQAGFCEVLFKWAEPKSDPTSPDFNSDDYSDACESPTYVCGQNQAAWYAQLVCKSTPLTASGTGCAGGWWFQTTGSADAASEPFLSDQPTWSANDYDIWHWVVAPSPSDCSGAQEPGFAFDTDSTSVDHPYLAHDLDVYTPAATAADEQGTANLQSYARNTVTGTLPVTQEDADSASEAVSLADVLPGQVQKGDRIEPNAAGDDSQSYTLDRSELDCDQLFGGQEQHIDPWVNVVDNKVHLDAVGEPTSGGFDLYLNEDETQDASNRPGYAMYFTDGKIGMFTDKNDDGEYDQVGAGAKIDQIQAQGAYPMIWDVELDADILEETGNAEKAMTGGCTPGFSDFDWTVQAKEAGYGPNTGLIQVVYLNEPTSLFNWATSETFPFPGGNNAFVFLSDGFETLLNHGTASQKQFVQDKIDEALAHIPASNPDQVLAHQFTDSGIKDFSDQCAEPTGGYTSQWGFTHTCGGEPGGDLCAGDTIVTQYTFENTDSSGVLGGSQIPVLDVDGDGSGEAFPTGVNSWTDVDPLDGDASRSDDTCDRPTHTHDDSYPDGCSGHQH